MMTRESDLIGPICDCHIHSFSRHAQATAGAYAPPMRDIADYIEEAAPLGIKRAVVVQASVDGTDNSRLVEVLKSTDGLELRGVAMVDPETADVEGLNSAGVRAIRIQDRARLGRSDLDRLEAFAQCAAKAGWHLELNTVPASFQVIAERLTSLPEEVRLVLDHIGHIDPLDEGDLNALRRLMDTGRVWIKLSPTRVSKRIGTYDDLSALVTKIGQTYETQCIWGSDWPHVMTEPPLPDIPTMLSLLRACLNEQQIRACLWSNPEKLYDF